MRRIGLLRAVAAAIPLAAMLSCGVATAQEQAARPMRMLVPYPAGGSADFLARLVGMRAAVELKRTVVIENRPGANGIIAVQALVNAPPDGHTVLFAVPGVVIFNSHIRKALPYDPLRQLTPVAMLARTQFVLVTPADMPFDSVSGLVAYARRNPGKLAFGSPGTGSHPHIAMEDLKARAGIDMLHIPYQGGAPAMMALIGRSIALLFDGAVSVPPHIRSGKVKALALSGTGRMALFPGVPNVSETFPGYDNSPWYGIFAPAGVPAGVVARLHKGFVAAVEDADTAKRMVEGGYAVIGGAVSPTQFATIVAKDFERYGKIIRSIGIERQ
ncbi:MAG: tripartite tricarboxylate transporter substrate binding protein [Burkholderiales bacterium]|nr:tripartite tricarboxylate transporter substrate binding protein [Burkholderiales bacterium]